MTSAFQPTLQALAPCFLAVAAPSPSPTLPASVPLQMPWPSRMRAFRAGAFLLACICPILWEVVLISLRTTPAPVNYVGSRRSQHRILLVLHVLFPQPWDGFRDGHTQPLRRDMGFLSGTPMRPARKVTPALSRKSAVLCEVRVSAGRVLAVPPLCR